MRLLYGFVYLVPAVTLWFLRYCHGNLTELRLLVLLPEKKGNFLFPFGMEQSGAAVQCAKEDIENEGILGNITMNITYVDSKCDPVYGLGAVSDHLSREHYHAIIGPQCSGVCRHVGRLAAYHNKPCFTGVCQDVEMLDKTQFKTLSRFLGTFDKLGQAVKGVLSTFGWSRVGLIVQRHTDKVWLLTRDSVRHTLSGPDYFLAVDHIYDREKNDSATEILMNVSSHARIIIIAVRGETLREFMLAAHRLGMVNGDYIFICVYYYASKKVYGDISWKQNDTLDDTAYEAYKSIIFLSYYKPQTSRFTEFEASVKAKAAVLFNYQYEVEEELPYPAANLYEAVYLYAIAVQQALAEGRSIDDGETLSQSLWNRSYPCITGNVSLNSNGDREQAYKVEQLAMTPASFSLKVIGRYDSQTGSFINYNQPYWIQGDGPPSDRPACGFSGEFCQGGLSELALMKILVGTFVGVILILVIVSVAIQRTSVRRMQKRLNLLMWRITAADVVLNKESDKRHSLFSVSKASECESIFPASKNFNTGYFKGTLVMMKDFQKVPSVPDSEFGELQLMRNLDHANVVKILGFCVDPGQVFMLTEFATKGSLMDVLENEDINLDWDIKCCILWDILRGLEYLFNSDLRYHGNLKSSNCVVDGRFVIKLTDFGPKQWIAAETKTGRDLLWTAPEKLRSIQIMGYHQHQMSDIYSVAILMHEILQRSGPFGIENLEINGDEIITLVSLERVHPFRPHFETNTCPAAVELLVKKCWDENPSRRPSIKELMKELDQRTKSRIKADSFFDNLLKRMENYANNLEELVEQRTAQYLVEKRRTEDLLHRLLPISIAHQIQTHGTVQPEWFESVTLMFSDIVHFTALSAESTPMQIVEMLNDLYSVFDDIIDKYDVYKVETIGDAYMCVSGLPQRNTYHSTELTKLSIAIMRASNGFAIKHRPGRKLQLRVGLHTGPCVAGVVGLKMPRYCLFGDTVNTASRMESTSEANKIQVSQVTFDLLVKEGNCILHPRGDIQVKGKGNMRTYWLEWQRPSEVDRTTPMARMA